MSVPKVYKLGDPCPACGGTLEHAPQATPEERARAANRDDPHPLPPHYDTASLEQIAELGELWRCGRCGYPHREKPAADPAAEDAKLDEEIKARDAKRAAAKAKV